MDSHWLLDSQLQTLFKQNKQPLNFLNPIKTVFASLRNHLDTYVLLILEAPTLFLNESFLFGVSGKQEKCVREVRTRKVSNMPNKTLFLCLIRCNSFPANCLMPLAVWHKSPCVEWVSQRKSWRIQEKKTSMKTHGGTICALKMLRRYLNLQYIISYTVQILKCSSKTWFNSVISQNIFHKSQMLGTK